MRYKHTVEFAYFSAYLTKYVKEEFDYFYYYNHIFLLADKPDDLYYSFIDFLFDKGFCDMGWCISFKKFFHAHKTNKYVETFKNYSLLDDESVNLVLCQFITDVESIRGVNEMGMLADLDGWMRNYGRRVMREYRYLFPNKEDDELIVENLPKIKLTLPKIQNEEKVTELIYALEDVEDNEICLGIIDKLKEELSIALGIGFEYSRK